MEEEEAGVSGVVRWAVVHVRMFTVAASISRFVSAPLNILFMGVCDTRGHVLTFHHTCIRLRC